MGFDIVSEANKVALNYARSRRKALRREAQVLNDFQDCGGVVQRYGLVGEINYFERFLANGNKRNGEWVLVVANNGRLSILWK